LALFIIEEETISRAFYLGETHEMKTMHYKIAQLILTPGAKTSTTCEVFIAQPDSTKERLAGKLFVLAELDGRNVSNLKFINYIIDDLNRNYYQNEKIVLREKVSSIKIETIFESALARTNKNIGELLQDAKFSVNLSDINMTIGVVFENELHFSIIGKNKAQLIFRNKNENEANKYKITETTERNEEDQKTLNPNKLFTNIINGALPPDGYLLFTNETLPEYLSNKQILDIVTTLPPTGALEQVKNLLTQVNAYVSFLAILIKNTTGQPLIESRTVSTRTTAQTSISSLKTTEDQTERLLTPSGIIDIRKWISSFNQLFDSFSLNKGGFSSKEKILLADKLSFKKRSGFKIVKNIWQNLKLGLLYILQLLIHLPQLFNKNLFTNLSRYKNNFTSNSIKPIFWFKTLGQKQKIIISVALISIILFLQNSISISFKNKNEEKRKNDQEIIKLIEQKENQVDSSLLYNNEDGAALLLAEISGLIAQLPKKISDKQTLSLIEKYNQLNIKIRHEIKVEPEELADYTKLKDAAQPQHIIILNGKIYAADSANKNIYAFDLKDKSATTINPDVAVISYGFPAVNDNSIYFYNQDNVIELNTELSTSTALTINSIGDKNGLVDQSFYNNKLYTLDAVKKQIYRYDKTLPGFKTGSAWLKNSSDLDSPIDFAVDGSIYVLNSKGEISRFLKGKKEELKLNNIQPALLGSTKITATEKNLYVLDPKNKRIVAYEKTGKLLAQYQSDRFTDLKDFVIDESAKKIFILNGATLLQINI